MSEELTPRRLVVFMVGDEEYALPIEAVQEIIRYTEPRSVASSVGWVRGVISLRGKIVPVFDLAARLGQPLQVGGDDHRIVIVEVAADMAGIIVGSVQEVMTVDQEQLEELPSDHGDAIEAIAKIDDRLIVLLSAAGLFDDTADVPTAA
jgi:purine-binding chemotaxis protein CheW